MASAPIPPDEETRLAALHRYGILDTVPEQVYDDLTLLASSVCGTPIAVVSFVDRDRQWFKSKVGIEASETPRDVAFCAHAILQRDVFTVPDAAADGRFADNPFVASGPGIRFYAGAPLVTPDGHALGTLCVIDRHPRSLTPEAQAALRALARQAMGQLELRIKIAEVEEARRAAEEATRAKVVFLATMSHEIRTPMHAVIGMSDLLLRTELSPLQKEYARTIRSGGAALLAVVNDILDFSRIESGGFPIESVPFRLADCLREALSITGPAATEKGLTLSSTVAPGVAPILKGDGNRLRQVLVNLLGNAVKFTKSGGVAVSVEPGEGSLLHFRVQDTGIGIPRDRMDRLFRSFSQVDASVARHYGGSGLGLAISKGLCERMGGRIWAESREGSGSVFHFTIRAEAAPEVPLGDHEAGAAPAVPAALRILAAEDNPVNRTVLTAMLDSLGRRADIVPDGRSAVDAAAGSHYDVILMDVHMPGMDGLEAASRIRASGPRGARPWIVALTASVLAEDRVLCDRAGMDDFLAKPLQVADLRRALDRARPRAAAPAVPEGALVLDPGTLDGLRNLGGPGSDLLRTLVGLYAPSSRDSLERIRAAVAEGSAPAAARAAHALRGASLNLGAVRVGRVAERLEHAGNAGDLAAVAADLPELEAAHADAVRALEAEAART